LPSGVAGVIVCCAGAALAQVTQVYSFEPGLEGFSNNGNVVVSLNTDSDFSSEGSNSLKLEFPALASFVGAATDMYHPAINDPPGVDFFLFDLINTNRFVPEEPVVGVTPTYADIGVFFFGEFSQEPGVAKDIQFFLTQEAVGTLEPGTHEIMIDVTGGGFVTTGGGGGQIQGFNDWIADGYIPSGFYIYLNKNGNITPAFAWTIYIDNIRVGRNVEAVPGDYNENGIVDAADFTVWRDRLGHTMALPNTDPADLDEMVTADEYNFWVSRFGATSGGASVSLGQSAVPEPGTAVLLIVAGLCRWGSKRSRATLRYLVRS
jgi:hypothetical protein